MEYVKYLLKNPSKLLFPLGATIFSLVLGIVVFIVREEFILENSVGLFVFTEIFLLLILIVSNYQVYKEWKDGRNR